MNKYIFVSGLLLALTALSGCNNSNPHSSSTTPDQSATTASTFATSVATPAGTPEVTTGETTSIDDTLGKDRTAKDDDPTQAPPNSPPQLIVNDETPPPSKPLPPFTVKEEITTFLVNGQKVVGTLAVPEGTGPAPVILVFHGYTGSRDANLVAGTGGESLFSRAARLWATEGYASLRIDFRNSGESDGIWADTTFDGQIDDAIAAVAFLQIDKRVDGKRIAAVGWSQGGLVASALAAKTPALRAVGLWNAVTVPPLTYSLILGPQALKDGPAAANKLVGRTGLKGSFFQGIYTIDPVAEIARYDGPLFVAAGTNDSVVAPQPQMGNLFLKYHEGIEELWVRDMDHGFDKDRSAAVVDEMAKATLTLLRKGLDK
ncbi:alpha/beta hydrolase family protein [Phyllobacterium bourgognense]|uniref:Xaa-Pro dipeptidyl-peptidase-like domain-containing protein n=1 Tax=Phyllobacterium bourgognense TaxID=314236 RepID=A0A368YTW5_9HYPH|nr:alpha/beta fold hydrolase [Phyllobacterium bourgognense]RCW83069.1 hypothetical protein C7476_106102 [Phyllobacterium bourgognense]